jgi:signal transduction histidine kinase
MRSSFWIAVLILLLSSCSFSGNKNRLVKNGLTVASASTSLEDINKFLKAHPNIDSFSFNSEVHWFRFPVKKFNNGLNALVVPDYQINSLRLFLVSDSQAPKEILVTGDEIPVSQYSNNSRSNVALIDLYKSQKYEILAKYSRPGNRPQLVMNLMSLSEYKEYSVSLEWSYGLIYGLLVIYLFLVLSVLIWTRDVKYFFFLLWVMSYLVYFSTTSGHLKFYLFPEMKENFSLIRLQFMLISMYAMTEFSLLYYGYRKSMIWVIYIWFGLFLWSFIGIIYEPITGDSMFEGHEKAYIYFIRGIFFSFITLQFYLAVKWIVKNKSVSFLSVIFILYLLNMFLYLYQTVYLDNVDFDYFILATVWFLILEILSIAGGLSYYLMKDSQKNLFLLQQNTLLKQEINRVYFTVQEQEKRRIAREIHDDILNRLSMFLLLSRDGYLSQNTLVDRLRLLSRDVKLYTLGLYPIWVKKMNIHEIIDQNIQELCNAINIHLKKEISNNLPPLNTTVKLQLFRIMYEFISNSGKYANSKNVFLSINYYIGTEELILNIFDDGVGLEPNHKKGLGLKSIQNRVSILNGTMSIQNKPGYGLEWTIIIPLQNTHFGELQYQGL